MRRKRGFKISIRIFFDTFRIKPIFHFKHGCYYIGWMFFIINFELEYKLTSEE